MCEYVCERRAKCDAVWVRVCYTREKCANTKRIVVVNVWQCVWLRSTVDVCVLGALSQLLFHLHLPVHEEENFTAITKTESAHTHTRPHTPNTSHMWHQKKKNYMSNLWKFWISFQTHPHSKLDIWKSLFGARERGNKGVTKQRNANTQNSFDIFFSLLSKYFFQRLTYLENKIFTNFKTWMKSFIVKFFKTHLTFSFY